MAATSKKVALMVGVAAAIGRAIHELGSVPSGEIYANVMGHMSFNSYNSVIAVLKGAGLVKESNYMLTYTGKHSYNTQGVCTVCKRPVPARAGVGA